VQTVDRQWEQIGAVATFGVRRGFTRFMDRFSDDELAIVWKFGTSTDAPFPGRRQMARFMQPIPGSWRDILRRAVRALSDRSEHAALRALLVDVLAGHVPPVPRPAPAPRALSPQDRCHRFTPVRGSPETTPHMRPVMPGAPPM
jgi:hypothetical protein